VGFLWYKHYPATIFMGDIGRYWEIVKWGEGL